MRSKSQLRELQQRVATALYERNALQAVVPMGGGKTAAALTAARELIDDGEIKRMVVVAPPRVARKVWTDEVLEWEHLADTRIAVAGGDVKQRIEALNSDAEIVTVSMNVIQWLLKYLKKPGSPKFDVLCVDECSKFKNPRGKWGVALQNHAHLFPNIWMLTGTPRPNGYEDQFRPISILSRGKAWGTKVFDQWRMRHFMPDDYNQTKWTIRPEHEAKVLSYIRQYTLTVDPSDMPDVPELVVVPHWVDLPREARLQYDKMQKDYLIQYKGNVVAAMNAAIAEGKLAQIANGAVYNEDHEALIMHREKLWMTEELVEALDGDPAILVYEFLFDRVALRESWPDLPVLGGGTSNKDAERFENEWNARQLPLLGMHPASAAHGLNLQHGGNQMIVYGFPWSAELYDQMIKRIHRPGQKERCFVHLILARGTVDEVKYDRVVRKINDQIAFTNYLERFK